jgi:hypothetical protein
VRLLAIDANGAHVNGLTTLLVRVSRASDDFYFDWSDNTFRSLPLSVDKALVQVDVSLSPGEYKLNTAAHVNGFDTSRITNAIAEDVYRFTANEIGTTLCANMPQFAELRVGGFVDFVDEAISYQASPAEVRNELVNMRLNQLVQVNPGATPPTTNTFIWQLLNAVNARATHQIFQSYAYDPIADIVSGQVWVESANLMVTAATSATVSFHATTGSSMFTVACVGPDPQGVFRFDRATPGFVANQSYYAVANVAVPSVGTITGAKGAFTIGAP